MRKTRDHLAQEVSREVGLTIDETKAVLEGILNAIEEALLAGKEIELRKFGIFKLRHRKARNCRDIRRGETIHVPAKIEPVFVFAKELKARVAEKLTKEAENVKA